MFVISENGHTINNGRCLEKRSNVRFLFLTQKHRDDEAVVTAEVEKTGSCRLGNK